MRKSSLSECEICLEGYAVGDLPKSIIPHAALMAAGKWTDIPVRMMYYSGSQSEIHRKNGETISERVLFLMDVEKLLEEKFTDDFILNKGYVFIYGEVKDNKKFESAAVQHIQVSAEGKIDASAIINQTEYIFIDIISVRDIRRALKENSFGITSCAVSGDKENPTVEIHGWVVTMREPDISIKDMKKDKNCSFNIYPEAREDIKKDYPEAYSRYRNQIYTEDDKISPMMEPGFCIIVSGKCRHLKLMVGFHDHMIEWSGKAGHLHEKGSRRKPGDFINEISIFGITEIWNRFRKWLALSKVRNSFQYEKWLATQREMAKLREKSELKKISTIQKKPEFLFLILPNLFSDESEKKLRENLQHQLYDKWDVARFSSDADDISGFDYVIPVVYEMQYERTYLHDLVLTIQGEENAGRENVDIIYTDEDYFRPGGKRHHPWIKTDFDADYLLSCNYIGNASAFRSCTWNKLIKESSLHECDKCPVMYEIVLRAFEAGCHIVHLPKVLVSLKELDDERQLQSEELGVKALQEHLDRTGYTANVISGHTCGQYHTEYEITETPLVSVILCGADSRTLRNPLIGIEWKYLPDDEDSHKNPIWKQKTEKTISSFNRKSAYGNLEFVDTYDYMEEYFSPSVDKTKEKCRFSDQCNKAVVASEGEYLLFIEAGAELLHRDSLLNMLGFLIQRQDVGAIGGKLYCSDGTILHSGVKINKMDPVIRYYIKDSIYDDVPYNYMDYPMLHRGVVLMRRKDFEMCGGFDVNYDKACLVEDLTFRMSEHGLKSVYDGHAEYRIDISKTKNARNCFSSKHQQVIEKKYFREKWKSVLTEI